MNEYPECPYCHHVENDFSDIGEDIVTYWGEDGPVELECPNCEMVYDVNEHVTRRYTSTAKAQPKPKEPKK